MTGHTTSTSPMTRARGRLLAACAIGVVAAVVGGAAGTPILAVVAGWIGVAGSYSVLTWHAIRTMSADEVRWHATRDEPGKHESHWVLILTSVFSLVGVGVLLAAGSSGGSVVPVEALVGTASVAASWTLVHVIFTLRYAGLYYRDEAARPVDFGDDDPDYQDFAYLAFTLGMTYQVSDTALRTRSMRRTVLRHVLLSYLLGAVVIASTINLVVQVASTH